MKSMSWLHISDLHFQKDEEFDRRIILRTLLEFLDAEVSDENVIDFIVVTGDIAYSGKPDEYAAAGAFFDRLLQVTRLTRDRLVIVPGNHDVDRDAGIGLARTLSSSAESDKYFDPSFDKPHFSLKFKAFIAWYGEYFSDIRRCPTNSSIGPQIEIDNSSFTVCITPINSALFSQGDDDHGKLLIGHRCLDDALQELASSSAHLKIAAFHHPLDWLSELERQTITALIRRHFDLVLRGHLHEGDVEDIRTATGDFIQLSAGAAYQTEAYPNTAFWLSFDGAELQIRPIRYEKTPLPVWTTDPSLFPQDDGFKKKIRIKNPATTALGSATERVRALLRWERAAPLTPDEAVAAKLAFQEELFVAPNGNVIYVEPRIMDCPQEFEALQKADPKGETIEAIANSTRSYFIEAAPEYGGSTLCRRIQWEIERLMLGGARLADAMSLPNYEKKLREHFSDVRDGPTLILDNFDDTQHQRLLRELISLDMFSRFIVIVSGRELRSKTVITSREESHDFEYRHVWGMDRAGIRKMAIDVFEAKDQNTISLVVDKVYTDLLTLRIPLTPSNVIMYLHVLRRDDDFEPLNKVDILDRYLLSALRRPSDEFKGAFSAKNKIDVLASFVHSIFKLEQSTFYEPDWTAHCADFQSENLIAFDTKKLFQELVSARIFLPTGRAYYLKYSFFYSFLVARHLANRPAPLATFLADESYFKLWGVVEALSGLSADSSMLVEALCRRLEGLLDEFDQQYVDRSFDPLLNAVWGMSASEEQDLWLPIEEQIREGPREPEEIDLIKSSLKSEARTRNQEVVFHRFSELEILVFKTANLLEEALRSADVISADLKKRSLSAIYRSYLIVLQVGSMLSKVIASSRYVRWGGIHFINHSDPEEPQSESEISPWVILAINDLIAQKLKRRLGSRKLGALFRSMADSKDLADFERYANFACLLASKPQGWDGTCNAIIRDTPKNSYRLRAMLKCLIADFRDEVNQHRDREELKRLIALIQAKRNSGKDSPGEKSVGRMLGHLEKVEHFEKLLEKEVNDQDQTGDDGHEIKKDD